MGKKSIISLLFYAFIAAALAFFVYNGIKKRIMMGTKKEMLKNANNDIRDYKQLGFSDDSELIQLLHGRLQRIENRITQLQNQTFMNTKNAPTQNRKQLQYTICFALWRLLFRRLSFFSLPLPFALEVYSQLVLGLYLKY